MNTYRLLLLWIASWLPASLWAQCDSSFTITPDPTVGNYCAGDTFCFTPNADPNTILSYNWDFGNATGSTDRNPCTGYAFNGVNTTYTVSLTVVDTSGTPCTSTQTITIEGVTDFLVVVVDSTQKCDIGLDSTATFSPGFFVTNPLPASAYPITWDFGNGQTATTLAGDTARAFYDCFGTYTVTATLNGDNCPAYTRNNVYFYTDFTTDFQLGGGQSIFCEGQPITAFNIDSAQLCGNIDYYLWDWNVRGATGGVLIPGPTYTLPQADTQSYTYQFNLPTAGLCNLDVNDLTGQIKVTGFNGCFPPQGSATDITVLPQIRAGLDLPDTICVTNASINVAALGFSGGGNTTCPDENFGFDPTQFIWSFGNGDSSTLPEPFIDYSADGPGTYVVTLIAFNSFCSADTVTDTVVVLEPPIAAFTLDTNQVCAPGGQVNFTDQSTVQPADALLSYTWTVAPAGGSTFCDSTTANSQNPTICFNQAGTYLVTLTVTNFCGFDTATAVVTVNQSPQLVLDTLPDSCGAVVVNSLGYLLDDFGAAITDTMWTTTGMPGTISGGQIGTVLFDEGQLHEIILSVENFCGITSDTISFTLDSLPTVLAGNDTVICVNDTGPVFSGTPALGYWTGPGVDSSGKFIPPSVGTFSLVYNYEATLCFAYDTLLVTVTDTPQVVARPDTAYCADSSVVVTLTATPAGGTWFGDNVFGGNFFRSDTAGVFVITYSYQDSTGCAGQDEVIITVNPLPEVNIVDSTIFFCLTPDPQQLPTPIVPATGSGFWFGSNAITDPIAGDFVPDSLGGPDTVTVFYQFTTDSGCVNLDSLVVEVISADSTFAGPGDSLCFNAGLDTLAGFFPNGGIWTGMGIVDSSEVFDPLLMVPGNNEVVYTFAPGTSCEASDTTLVFVRDTVALAIVPTGTICEDVLPFTLAVNVGGGIWSGQGITNPTTGAYDPAIVPPGSTDSVRYTLANGNGCVSRDVDPILVDSLPTAGFAPPANTCIGVTVPFVNTSTYASTYQWNFGDGGSSSLPTPTHVYTVADTYTVCLTVFSVNNCVDSYCDTIIVSEPPTASYIQDQDSGCAVLPVFFTDQSNPAGGSYLWDFGNGQTDSTATPGTILFDGGVDDTTYTVTLTIQNGCATVSQSSNVTVFPLPNIVFGPSVNQGCSVFPVDLVNVSTGGPSTYAWYNAEVIVDSLFSTDSIPPTQFYSYPLDTGFAEFDVFLVATNVCGSDTATQTITVFPNTIDAFFNSNPVEGCEPLTVQFTGLSGAPFTGWSIDGSNPPDLNPSYTFTSPGVYEVLHFANNGCSFDTNSVVITVRAKPDVSFDVSDTIICQGGNVTFTNTSLNTNGAEWLFGDGGGTTLPNPTHTYTQAGTYTVALIAFSDTNNCPDTAYRDIVVRPEPPITFTLTDTAGCPPFTLTADGSASLANGYLWNPGDGSGPGVGAVFTHTYQVPGVYALTLTVTDVNGCPRDSSAQIVVHPVPTAGFTLSADTLCGNATPVVFTTTASPLPLQHQWIIDDGAGFADTLSSVDPTYLFPAPGVYSITQTVSNGFGCQDMATGQVVILPQPIAQIGVSDSADCVPFPVTFTDLSTGNGSRVWEIDGQSLTNATETYTFLAGDTIYEVILIADTADFCFDRDTILIETAEPPVAQFLPSGTAFCFDTLAGNVPVSFQDQSIAGAALDYAWHFGDGNTDFVASPTHAYLTPGHYEVQLTVTHPFGCTDVATDSVFIYPQPVAQIGVDSTTGCVPFTVNFSDLSTDNSTRTWYVNGDTLSNAVFAVTFLVPDTTYMVILEVDTAGSCGDADTVLIQTASLPQAAFAMDSSRFCDPPAAVQFSNLSTATLPLTYEWDLGDSTNSPLADPAHVYTTVAHHPVTLVATNSFGCRDTARDTVYVYPQPVAAFAADSLAGCVPFTVQLTDLSTDAADWLWIINGDSLSSQNADYTFIDPDTSYLIQLIVDTANFCFDQTQQVINVATPPVADYRMEWDEFCGTPATNTFTNASLSTRPLNYSWDFGDGTSSVLPSPTKVFAQTGQYVISLAVVNDYGCRDTLIDTVDVYPQPEASFLVDPERGCAPMAVQFTNTSTGFSNSLWDFGDGTGSSRATNPGHTYFAADTSFLVRLQVDTAGFCFDDTSFLVRVASYPDANFEASVTENCGPTEVQFTDLSFTADLPISYEWDFGNGERSSVSDPVIRYETPGTYEVQLTVRNAYGCPDSFLQIVEIIPQPAVFFVADDQEGCEAFTVQFSDLSENVNGWQWDFGDGRSSNDQNPTHTYVQFGLYDVTLIANFDGRCLDTLQQREMILVQPNPIADFRYEDSLITDIPDGTISFVNLTENGQNYSWDLGDGSTSNDINPVHRYVLNDSFLVVLQASLGDCVDSTSQWIQPFYFGNLHVPNAFAPLATGPGTYTRFFPKGIGLTEYHIAVYSTWGDLVWESRALEDGVPSEWWDGTINGRLVTQDVFIWKVHIARFEGGREWSGPREGSITVVK